MVKFKLTDDISTLSNTFELKIRIIEPFLAEKEDEGDRQVFEAPVQEIVYKAEKLKENSSSPGVKMFSRLKWKKLFSSMMPSKTSVYLVFRIQNLAKA